MHTHEQIHMCTHSQAPTQAYSKGPSFQQVTRESQPETSQTPKRHGLLYTDIPLILLCAPLNPFLHSEARRKLKLQLNMLEAYSKPEKFSNITIAELVVAAIVVVVMAVTTEH